MPIDLTPPKNFHLWPEEQRDGFRSWADEQRALMKRDPKASVPTRPRPMLVMNGQKSAQPPVPNAASSTSSSGTSSQSPAAVTGITDMRQWDKDCFGVSGERLRNCLIYWLDYAKHSWLRDNPPTPKSMTYEKFVKVLDEKTPPGWTPAKHANAERLAGIDVSRLPEYRKPKYSLVARIKDRNRIYHEQ